MRKAYFYVLMFVAGLCMLSSCDSMNDLHDPYLRDGETIYLVKFDSLSLHPGRGRVMIEYWLSDPKAKKCLVEWSLGTESKLVDVSMSEGTTPNVFCLDDLPESTISFDFTSCTEDLKYRSLVTNSTCSVYGDRYVSTLMNATVTSPSYNVKTGELSFLWSSNYENVVAYNVKYVTASGLEETVRLPVTENRKVLLPDFPENGSFEYATVYLPSPLAIDEFFTAYATYTVK